MWRPGQGGGVEDTRPGSLVHLHHPIPASHPYIWILDILDKVKSIMIILGFIFLLMINFLPCPLAFVYIIGVVVVKVLE